MGKIRDWELYSIFRDFDEGVSCVSWDSFSQIEELVKSIAQKHGFGSAQELLSTDAWHRPISERFGWTIKKQLRESFNSGKSSFWNKETDGSFSETLFEMNIPENTCPMIDEAIELIKKDINYLENREDKDQYIEDEIEYLKDQLKFAEELRTKCEEVREFAKDCHECFWKNLKYKIIDDSVIVSTLSSSPKNLYEFQPDTNLLKVIDESSFESAIGNYKKLIEYSNKWINLCRGSDDSFYTFLSKKYKVIQLDDVNINWKTFSLEY